MIQNDDEDVNFSNEFYNDKCEIKLSKNCTILTTYVYKV